MKRKHHLAIAAIIGLTISSCGTAYKSARRGESDYEAAIERDARSEAMRKHHEESADKIYDRSLKQ